MFEALKNIFKKSKIKELANSKDAAKERLHLVLMQDRANVSADFLDLMRAEIVEVIKKYIDIDEKAMDVRLTTETNEDGTQGGPALYANIPIINIKEETRKLSKVNQDEKIISQPPKNVKNDKNEDDSKLVEKETDNNKSKVESSQDLENKKESIKNQETENKTVDIVVSNSDENIDKNNVHKDKSKKTNNDVEKNNKPKKENKENEESKENINKTEKIEKDETKNENQINNSNENKEDIKEKKNEE